jgi:membrane-associated phospholipid phosphatase
MQKQTEHKVKMLELISLKVLVAAILFIASSFVFAIIVHEVLYENEKGFDTRVGAFFDSFSTERVVEIMKVFTFFGTVQFLIPAYTIIIASFLLKKKFRVAIDIAIVAIISSALMFALKAYFHRERPELPIIRSFSTYSFPSGHALCSFIFCSILIYLIDVSDVQKFWKWTLSIFLLLFSFIIGISRIILHMHYPTDVVAGFCLGIVFVILSFWILKKINYKNIFTRKRSGSQVS